MNSSENIKVSASAPRPPLPFWPLPRATKHGGASRISTGKKQLFGEQWLVMVEKREVSTDQRVIKDGNPYQIAPQRSTSIDA